LKKIYLIFLLLLLSGTSLFSQLSKKHYIPPVTGANSTSGPGSQILYISTPSTSKVNYTVRYGGDIGTTATSGTPFATGQVINGDPEQVLIANNPADNTVQWSEVFVNPSQTEVVLKSHNKQILGQAAAEIRAFRPPEPYKGKGVRYADEQVKRKEAKKAAGAGAA